MSFYIQKKQKQKGPYTLEQLKTQKITPETLVWKEGLEDWTEAKNLEELKPLLIAPPPISKKTPPPIKKSENSFFSIIGIVLVLVAGLFGVWKFMSPPIKGNPNEKELQVAKSDTTKAIIEKRIIKNASHNEISELLGIKVHYKGTYNGWINYITNSKGEVLKSGDFELENKGKESYESASGAIVRGRFKNNKPDGVIELGVYEHEYSNSIKIKYKNGKCLWGEIDGFAEGDSWNFRDDSPKDCSFESIEKKYEEEQKKKYEEEKQKDFYRNNGRTYLKVYPNEYDKNLVLGGIWNLQVKLQNDLPYHLQKVIVEVSYMKVTKSIYKKETVTFRNVPPNKTLLLPAPNSDKGIEAKTRIVYVECQALELK